METLQQNPLANPLRKAWELDHIGHAVKDLVAAEDFYCKILGYTVETREALEDQKVEVSFLRGPNGLIELIAPLPGNQNLQRFLSSRGEGLHHLCYWVPSVEEELKKLKATGIKLIDQSPRLGSREMQVAFLHPSSCQGVLVEICSE